MGIAWVVFAAGAVMTPALAHGWSLGPYDTLWHFGLSHQPGAVTRDVRDATDQISQLIPWSTLAWQQVHQGHLPLWNPYSALGTPLAFNWQSATFGLPALVGYAFPLRLAYTVQVLTTLLLAGTGTYVLARVLRLGVLAAAFAGTVFELSGAFMLFLGWPIASVLSMTGWLFAATVLITRGSHRLRQITFFAVVLAFTIYAGQPDALFLVALGVGLFAAVLVILRLPVFGRPGPILIPVFDLTVAIVAGLALAAPLVLPGLQVADASIRSLGRGVGGLQSAFSPKSLETLAFVGINGHVKAGGSLYLGVLVVVLAINAVGLCIRRPEVIALLCVLVVMAAIAFIGPVDHALNVVPGLHSFRLPRSVVVMTFCVAVLAGMGIDLVLRSLSERRVTIWMMAVFLAALVALVWVSAGPGPNAAAKASRRNGDLAWSAAEIGVGLVGIGLLILARRRKGGRRDRARQIGPVVVGTVWLACATAFLVDAGGPVWPSSPSFITTTPAEAALQRAVGSSLVGYGIPYPQSAANLGIRRNDNIIFGVQEMAVIDPMLPRSYFQSWTTVTGRPGATAGFPLNSTYSPAFTSARIARAYGVGFVLGQAGQRGPRGAVFDTKVGNEDLYRIPGAGAGTLTPFAADGADPSVTTTGAVVPVTRPGPASWTVHTDAATPQLLRLHLTDSPGWHATIDGRPLALSTFADVMLQARVPAGRHIIRLHYWPDTFNDGMVLATLAALGLVAAWTVRGFRTRRNIRLAHADGVIDNEKRSHHG